MGQFLRRQVVLQNTQPGHNKYYEMNVYQQDADEEGYSLRCRWGRIEHFEDGSPQSQIKLTKASWPLAEDELDSIMYAKLKKGYKVKKDHGKGTSKSLETVDYPSKSVAKRVEAQKGNAIPSFDRTEHIEVAQSDWWTTAPIDIEERAV